MATFTQDRQPYGPRNTCHCGLERLDHEDSDYAHGGCRFTPAMRKAQRLERMAPELLAALEALFADNPADPSHLIAAAPDLLAELTRLCERVAHYAPAMERNGDLNDARAVIARARGAA